MSRGTAIGATSRIGAIPNPSGIVILKEKPTAEEEADELALTERNAQVLEIRSVPARTLRDQVEWSIESVNKLTGEPDPNGGRAAFLVAQKGGAPVTGQTKIKGGGRELIYGVKEGRVRVKASYRGCAETYEAYVLPQKNALFRVQLLSGETKGLGTRTTAGQAEDHIRVANILLRQVGVRLKPDPDITIDPRGRKNGKVALIDKKKPGFFAVTVADDLVKDVGERDAPDSIRVNDRDSVLQICYINNCEDTANGRAIGMAPNFPENPAGLLANREPGLTLKYRIRVEDRSRAHSLTVSRARLPQQDGKPVKGEEKTWGTLVSNDVGDPVRDQSRYGKVLAHELGHVFGLLHRIRPPTPERVREGDGLIDPVQDNLMYPQIRASAVGSEDLDLIQCIAVRTSRVLSRP